MKNILFALLGAVCAIPAVASAEDYYVGLSTAMQGTVYADFGADKHVENQSQSGAVKLYGGYNFNDRLALEAGYGNFGTYTVHNPANQQDKVELRVDTSYAALKGTLPLSPSFALFGKLGVARNGFDSSRGDDRSKGHSTSLMGGVGAEYHITERLAGVLEIVDYGKSKGRNVDLQRTTVELGLRYAF
ncbi:MAG TPA: hypothetical protein DCW29_05780 [Janthinobacterium sp.]|nr:hypothetical protein [Janthinobacterium sp.]